VTPTPKYTGPERRQRPRWRPRPVRVLLVLLLLSAIGYAAAVMWLVGRETQLVFQAGSTLATGRPPFPYEQVDLPRADGVQQFAWVMRTGDSDTGPWVLYLHGNASSVASQVNIAHYQVLRNAGLNVLAPEYRGFGGVPGSPTEADLQADARAAYDYLRDTRRVPPQLVDLAGRRYPFFPLRLFMRSSFDSIRKIGTVPAPILFVHSLDDEVIPISEGRRLHQEARGATMFVELKGGHTGAIDQSAAILEQAIRTFLDTYGPGPRM
jgi:dipeptidyl aminopeptidase/acylaminoacyl peptidase